MVPCSLARSICKTLGFIISDEEVEEEEEEMMVSGVVEVNSQEKLDT